VRRPQLGGLQRQVRYPPNLGFVETVFLGIPVRGVPTIVRPASSSNPAEDLIVPLGGPVPVSQFYADGMVSAAVNEHFGSDLAVQLEYAPYGHPTGLCTAVAVTAFQDEGLSLQPCSAPGHDGVDPGVCGFAIGRAGLFLNHQRVGHRFRPPFRDDHPGESG
jgi:hypothetical protein